MAYLLVVKILILVPCLSLEIKHGILDLLILLFTCLLISLDFAISISKPNLDNLIAERCNGSVHIQLTVLQHLVVCIVIRQTLRPAIAELLSMRLHECFPFTVPIQHCEVGRHLCYIRLLLLNGDHGILLLEHTRVVDDGHELTLHLVLAARHAEGTPFGVLGLAASWLRAQLN